MRSVYRALALLVALGVLVQAAAIAFGVFHMINDVDGGAVIDSTYDSSTNPGLSAHSMGALIVGALAILLLLASFFVRFPGAKTWGVWTFVAVLAQWAFGLLAFGAPVVGLLHGANALAVFSLALLAARAAGRAGGAVPTAARRPATADA
ncbi:hypothetical protein [Georgenia ruanii]|uniref:Uncharacterized protein n=1 Tax=Georgenia ruanii TaxID=348442 RepID=A0A7J9V0I2_9MICO|nr:hypothetical protein [Georgenia ruanii]MPV90113.1 hypothetical protein [Georgenia ruanii]